jgi:VWFA-related protein
MLFFALACAIATEIAMGMPAQTEAAQADSDAPLISTNVDRVVLHATVRNHKGEFVTGLEQDNFKVFENGQEQRIRYFGHDDVPVAAGLIVDSSGSMGPKRPSVIAGATEFARDSNPKDEIFVLDFNEHVYSAMPPEKEFSDNFADLRRAILAAPASGRTALYDAVTAGFERVARSALDKKVLLVISDGGDNASHVTLKQLLDRALSSDIIVYAIGIFDADDPDQNPGVLKRIARATGGEAYFPRQLSEVTSLCERIAADIRNQYTIAYAPADSRMDGSYRRITVVARGKHGEKLSVRTREGYFARRADDHTTQ